MGRFIWQRRETVALDQKRTFLSSTRRFGGCKVCRNMDFVRGSLVAFGAIAMLLGALTLFLGDMRWGVIQIVGGALLIFFSDRYKSSS